MQREVDRHERAQTCRTTATRSRILAWRDAWNLCYRTVENLDGCEVRQFHQVFAKWVPILNRVLGSPIRNLDRYNMSMYYCDEPVGPEEIIHFYFNEVAIADGTRPTYVLFNLHEFRKLHRQFCSNYAQGNEMLVDEERGTVNMTAYYEQGMQSVCPALYYKNTTTWQLLFIFTLHAMAHLDLYDKYHNSFYKAHKNIQSSVFFKIFFYGQVVWR